MSFFPSEKHLIKPFKGFSLISEKKANWFSRIWRRPSANQTLLWGRWAGVCVFLLLEQFSLFQRIKIMWMFHRSEPRSFTGNKVLQINGVAQRHWPVTTRLCFYCWSSHLKTFMLMKDASETFNNNPSGTAFQLIHMLNYQNNFQFYISEISISYILYILLNMKTINDPLSKLTSFWSLSLNKNQTVFDFLNISD